MAIQGEEKETFQHDTNSRCLSFRFTAYAKNMPCTLSYVFELKSNLNQSKLTWHWPEDSFIMNFVRDTYLEVVFLLWFHISIQSQLIILECRIKRLRGWEGWQSRKKFSPYLRSYYFLFIPQALKISMLFSTFLYSKVTKRFKNYGGCVNRITTNWQPRKFKMSGNKQKFVLSKS